MLDLTRPDLAAEKRALRLAARARRREIALVAGADAAAAVAERFLERIVTAPGQVATGYWPIGDELDPRPLMQALHGRGATIGLPIVAGPGKCLQFRRWQPGDVLTPAVMGIPIPSAAAAPVQPDVLLVPLLAFDMAGYRLGYGGGYYDRTLAELREQGRPVCAIGLGYAGQEQEALPRAAWDQRLDWVVTEREARKFR